MPVQFSQPIYQAGRINSPHYIGLQSQTTGQTRHNFTHKGLSYNPATGTLSVNAIKFNQIIGINNSALSRSVATYLDTPSTQSIPQAQITDIVGYSATITPSSVNSKILVIINWSGEVNTVFPLEIMYGLKRNGGLIGQPVSPGTRTRGMTTASVNQSASNDASSTLEMVEFAYVDSPGTTQPCTYQVTIHSINGIIALYNNRTVTDTDSVNFERSTSSIILVEVS